MNSHPDANAAFARMVAYGAIVSGALAIGAWFIGSMTGTALIASSLLLFVSLAASLTAVAVRAKVACSKPSAPLVALMISVILLGIFVLLLYLRSQLKNFGDQ